MSEPRHSPNCGRDEENAHFSPLKPNQSAWAKQQVTSNVKLSGRSEAPERRRR